LVALGEGRTVTLLSQALAALVGLRCWACCCCAAEGVRRKLRLADALETTGALVWLAPLVNVVSFVAYYPLSSSAYDALRGLVVLAAWRGAPARSRRSRDRNSRVVRAAWAAALLVLAPASGLVAGLATTRRRAGAGLPRPDAARQLRGPLETLDATSRSSALPRSRPRGSRAERGKLNE
jgi:hypothetical protein